MLFDKQVDHSQKSSYDIKDKYSMWVCGDRKFLFECSTRYLVSERSKQVRYLVEHKKRNFLPPCIILFII